MIICPFASSLDTASNKFNCYSVGSILLFYIEIETESEEKHFEPITGDFEREWRDISSIKPKIQYVLLISY